MNIYLINSSIVLISIWYFLLIFSFLYNVLSICMVVFSEFTKQFYIKWLLINCFTDFINILDLFIKIKKGFTKNGINNNNLNIYKYLFCKTFLYDLLAILPIDILLFIWPYFFFFRLNRLAKIVRIIEIVKLIEHRIPWPLGFRLLRLATFCYLLFHWNACFYFFLSSIYGYEDSTLNDWTFSYQKIPDLLFPLCETRFDFYRNECLFPEENWRYRSEKINELHNYWEKRIGSTNFNNLTKKYAMSFYWSALTLVTLGEQPWPENNVQTTFEIIDTLIGLLLFAAIIGDIGIMVSNAHLEKAKFQEITDGCKRYMRIRNVNTQLYNRVINWIEYQWIWGRRLNESFDEKHLFQFLPPKLGLELAAESNVRLLLSSPLFSLCEKSLLNELAIKLKTLRLCPGDIVCRKGENAKAMFIVKYGCLEMPLDDEFPDEQQSSSFFNNSNEGESPHLYYCKNNEGDWQNRILKEGDIFGDWALISETKIPYTVRSIGYSLLFILGRDSIAVAFDEYPHSRRMVRRKAKLISQEYQKYWKRKDSLNSFDSAAEFSIKLINNKRREENEELLNNNDDDDCYYFMKHSSSNIENKLLEIQKNVKFITKEFEIAERNFLRSSSELKRLITKVEKNYQEQRPRLKQMLGIKQFWRRKNILKKTLIIKPEILRQEFVYEED